MLHRLSDFAATAGGVGHEQANAANKDHWGYELWSGLDPESDTGVDTDDENKILVPIAPGMAPEAVYMEITSIFKIKMCLLSIHIWAVLDNMRFGLLEGGLVR